jgi:hypothetical protein
MRIDFLSQEKNPRASDAFASDCACSGAKAKNQGRRLDEERNAVFNQSADLSTYPRKISVRTTRATARLKLVAEAVAGTAERFDVFARIPHRDFPGGRLLRRPSLVLAMFYYRLRDLL